MSTEADFVSVQARVDEDAASFIIKKMHFSEATLLPVKLPFGVTVTQLEKLSGNWTAKFTMAVDANKIFDPAAHPKDELEFLSLLRALSPTGKAPGEQLTMRMYVRPSALSNFLEWFRRDPEITRWERFNLFMKGGKPSPRKHDWIVGASWKDASGNRTGTIELTLSLNVASLDYRSNSLRELFNVLGFPKPKDLADKKTRSSGKLG